MSESTDPLQQTGEVRTELDCHNCGRDFIALIDYDVDGEHVIECPWCGHEHCRKIEGGKVTEARWGSRDSKSVTITPRRVWKHDAGRMQTSSASHFLRQRWLDKYGEGA